MKRKIFRRFGFNSIRFVTSGILFLFLIWCTIFDPSLPFNLPLPVYIIATLFYGFFPLCDIFGIVFKPLYKHKNLKSNYIPKEYNKEKFLKDKKRYDIGALISIILWFIFMGIVAVLFFNNIIKNIHILLLFGFLNFSIYFAVLFWCPFNSILIKPKCCMNCRIYSWDMFFNYCFLIFIPNIFTITLVALSTISLIKWEITYLLHPERYYTSSNAKLKCTNCNLDHCRQGKPLVCNKKSK